ncbi:MAG: phage virion morphogenesis protein [Methylotenera sp.]|nr:phage virion morphogenesis protein [Methylotenera sp.]
MSTEIKIPVLTALSGKIKNLTPLMRMIAADLKDSVMENFATQSAAGKPWAKLKASTLKQRKKKGYTGAILQRRGGGEGLKGSITAKHTADSASVGTNKVYAAIHQFGGLIHRSSVKTFMRKKKAGLSTKRPASNKMSSVRIPARPFLVISQKEIEAVKDRVTKWLMADRCPLTAAPCPLKRFPTDPLKPRRFFLHTHYIYTFHSHQVAVQLPSALSCLVAILYILFLM